MIDTFKIAILLGLAAGGTTLVYAVGQPQSNSSDSNGVQQAIRFERAKDAAAARQARLEAARVNKSAESEGSAANRGAVSGDGGVQAAIRFERAKNAADRRQARLEAKQPGERADSSVAASRHPGANR